MDGGRMETAKTALILFLKSLPVESFYNVYSFGSSYQLLHENNEKVNDVLLPKDIEEIKLLGANLGGTEILEPFRALSKVPCIKGYPRQIFLLTDGDVSNTESILEVISQESKFSRIHTIGIGSGASAKLIKEGARRGKGSSLMLADGDDVSGKIIDLLQKSLTPCLDKFEFKFDKSLIDIVAPNPENISAILKNEPFKMTLFLKPNIVHPFKTEVLLKCFDSFSKSTLEYLIKIDSENCEFHESVFKYGCHRYISDLLLSSKSKRDFSKDIFIARKIDLESEVIELSIKEQILCEKTAFICVIKEANDQMNVEKQKKGGLKFVVPSLVTAETSAASEIEYCFPTLCKSDSNFIQMPILGKCSSSLDQIKRSSSPLYHPYFFEDDSFRYLENSPPHAHNHLKKHSFEIIDKDSLSEEIVMPSIVYQFPILPEEILSPLSESDFPELNLKKDFLPVITLQKPNGLWEAEEKLFKALALEKSVVEGFITKEMKEKVLNETELLNYLITILVLAWLHKYCDDKKSNWKLIEKKSKQLLDVKLKDELSLDWESILNNLKNKLPDLPY